MTDEERMAIYAREIWDTDVMPTVTAHLVPLNELRSALAQDVDAAGDAHGGVGVRESSLDLRRHVQLPNLSSTMHGLSKNLN